MVEDRKTELVCGMCVLGMKDLNKNDCERENRYLFVQNASENTGRRESRGDGFDTTDQ